MTTIEFLAYLRDLDIQVWVEGDRLRCNAPEGSLTAELRSQLAARKTELLAFLQHQAKSDHYSIKPTARGQSSPLSFAQQRLWFLNQLAPNNPFYNVPAAIQLSGQLNLAALEQAFNQILNRHEALRTKFTQINGQPVQITASSPTLSLSVVDLQTGPEDDREAFAQQLAVEAAQRPFNLSTDCLLRVKLLRFNSTEHILLLVMHHIVADGWSLGVLIRELGTIYTAVINHQPIVLPDLPIQYADFAHWQHEWLQGKVMQTQLNYWQQQLCDLSTLNLPTDHPRPPIQTFRGTTQPIALSHELTRSLELLSQQEGVSLFMTLLAAFQTLLYRYTGQTDIAVGSPIANRHHSELEGLIGFFVNSLVLRTDLSGNPTFRELLSRVRAVALQAYTHQDLPFEKLVEVLDPERDLSRNPLFQVAFALQNAPVQPLKLPGLTLKPLSFDMGTTRFDLEFHLWEPTQGLSKLWQTSNTGLTGFVSYSTDLFDRTTIVRLIEHFQILLEGITAKPDGRIADLQILSPSERQQLLVDWNQTNLEYDRNICFHQLFESQVKQFPDLIAVDTENEKLTYLQLNQRVNQLAHYLQQIGVCSNTLVGLCVDRSSDALVGILAILKAGGAFVPLDPSHPRERLSFMLADARVSIVLAHSHCLEKLPEVEGKTICLDRDQHLFHQQSRENPESKVKAENLAYVIYTSGTTGQPKGVLLHHLGLCNVVQAQQQILHLSNHSRVLQFSSLSFDASVFEIAMALGSGSTLFIPPHRARLPGAALNQYLRDHAITHAILPPAVLAVLSAENLPELKVLVSGGEACSQQLVERWAVDRQFFNAYGPTEATIWATVAQLHSDGGKPSIGRPVANTKIYILDDHLQPVPIGVMGELYIGGEGVARGYLNRPDLTAARFIQNPLIAGETLYRTGDLARYRADGNIDFLGRTDDQIKLRGFRVELGEIEALLNQYPAVQKAVVLAHTHASEDQRLAAYFTLEENTQDLLLQQQLQRQQVQHWQTLYNETYSQVKPHNSTFNITGWNSSYTGKPIPEEHMKEWVDERSQHILTLQPQRVLEIGCGTGLLLFQIAPHCTEYFASDFSQPSLDYIQQHLIDKSLAQVKLLHQSADQFENIPAASFDVVILNSVVQYFPTLDYLMQVLTGAIQAVAPGGHIFIGDVRHLSLLPTFHAAVQFEQADTNLEQTQLQQRVQRSLFEDPELAIDPAFFYALCDRFPIIDRVKIQPLRGQYQNEMTQFRYDVVLQIGSKSNSVSKKYDSIEWLDWTQNQPTVETIRQHLINSQPPLFGIANIANARIKNATKISEWISSAEIPKTVGQMRAALENSSDLAIDPQDWWNLETELPYAIEICWSNSTKPGRYDVLFLQRELLENKPKIATPFMQQADLSRSWNTYTNQPLQAQFCRQLVPQLRHYLSQKLPDYMVPTAFIPLKTMPLTPSGKIDRRALPLRNEISASITAYVAPRSPVEATLVKVWTELLRLKQVGIHDNFFELGGHSLLATQMASRLRDAFDLEVPLRSVFEAPTIAQLANVVQTLQLNRTQTQVPALVKLDRASHRKLRSSLTPENKGNPL